MSNGGPRVLLWDAETAPNLVYTWGLWNQNVTIEKIVESGYMLCWAAKWEGEDEIYWAGLNNSTRREMLKGLHFLLNEADFVIHYNGNEFDTPWANAEFIVEGFSPPSPYKQIDLLRTVRKQFRFPSNKLDYVSQALGLGEKVKHPGFQLWIDCMAGQPEAWAKMEEYNRHDVVLLELLYERLQAWVPYHPNRAIGREGCPNCGSENVQKRGYHQAETRLYQRYYCKDCHTWPRGTKALPEKAIMRSVRV